MASPNWPPAPEQPPYSPSAAHVANDLRPLSLGEILDRTFVIYRRHFLLFAGISAASGVVQIVSQLLAIVLGFSRLHQGTSPLAQIGTSLASVIVNLLFLMATAVTSAATIYALGEVYLGRAVTVGSSLSAVAPRWLRYIGIIFWQLGSFLWLPLVVLVPAFALLGVATVAGGTSGAAAGGILVFLGIVGGGIGGFIFYLRNSLGIQASVVEALPVRPSMRRSKTLTLGTKGRIFVVLLLSVALYLVAVVAIFPATLALQRDLNGSHPLAQAWVLVIGFAAHVLVSPVAMIGLSLIYFDQRIRMEAFDIAFLLGAPVPAYQAAPYQPPPPPVPPSQYDYTTAQPLPPAPPFEAAPAPEPEPPTAFEPEQPPPPPPHDVPEP